MKIALVSARVRNNDVPFNLAQMRKYMLQAKAQNADLICFGESFLQGFDAFSWEYEKDRAIALSVEDDLFRQLIHESAELGIDLLFGFLERDDQTLYSSCALLGNGRIIRLYRRVSVGWKESTFTDDHYREGDTVEAFDYRGKKCLIALCGDLWDVTAPRFQQNQELTFWPLYISFSEDEWYGAENERQQYADKVEELGGNVLMINSVDDPAPSESPALGGCYWFVSGTVKAELPLGSEGMLVVEV
ncbi:MAG: carbon-nitrogen hydrolase family protein [Clostridia bacterium]|nr:carbon-nitrogen hydrolase family protein [Clostridia bacterium]